MVDQTPRTSQTREKQSRRKPWRPPSSLDAPPAPEGFIHRWIRESVMGFDDKKNLSTSEMGDQIVSEIRKNFN